MYTARKDLSPQQAAPYPGRAAEQAPGASAGSTWAGSEVGIRNGRQRRRAETPPPLCPDHWSRSRRWLLSNSVKTLKRKQEASRLHAARERLAHTRTPTRSPSFPRLSGCRQPPGRAAGTGGPASILTSPHAAWLQTTFAFWFRCLASWSGICPHWSLVPPRPRGEHGLRAPCPKPHPSHSREMGTSTPPLGVCFLKSSVFAVCSFHPQHAEGEGSSS